MAEKSLKKNAILNIIRAFNNIIFPIISFPYASRILLPKGIGKVNFANSVIEYFSMIASLGIFTYGVREAAKIRDDKRRLNKFARELFILGTIATVVSYSLLLIALFAISKFSEYRALLVICSTKVLVITVGLEWVYFAEEEFSYITMRSAIFQIISLILLFSFVHTPDDYLIYAGIGVFANVGTNLLNFFHSRKFINLLEKAKIELKKHLKPVMTFFGISCATKINNTLDAVMLGFMLTDISVGLYSAAIKISRLVIDLIIYTTTSFMPRGSYYLEKNRLDEYKLLVDKTCSVTFFFAIPFAMGLFALCEPIILIFSGEQFLPATSAMKILSLGIIACAANYFLNFLILTPQRKEKISFISQIIGICVNISLNLVLIKKWQVFGAALATIAVEFTWPLVILPVCWKYVKSKENFLGILKSTFGAILMYTVIYFAFDKIENALVKLAASFITGCTVYAIIEIGLRHQSALMIINMVKSKLKK